MNKTETLAAINALPVSKKHVHCAIDSPDGGDTCSICGHNIRNTEVHMTYDEWRTGMVALTNRGG